jgi:hypothetical protein
MRRLLSFIVFASAIAPLACGGDAFELATPGEETSVAEETDATPESDAPEDAADSAPDAREADASDTSDTGDTNDTCVPNACGGCKKLEGSIDAPCGTCADGKVACDGTDALTCVGARAANKCGGCATLTNQPDTACGACGDGKWSCDGTDTVKCLGARSLNACGGCATLSNAPGSACGACGGGALACDGKESVKCSDPVTTAPNTPCGTCGTSKFVCSSDGKSTYCSKVDDRNACGGCGTLAGAPGAACGTCGVWACDTSGASVTCGEPTPPTGATCGVCSKSKYVCVGAGVSACETPDDRKMLGWGPTDATVGTVDAASPRRAHGLELKAAKTGSITSAKLLMTRRAYECAGTTSLPHPDPACSNCSYISLLSSYSCTVGSPTAGSVRATLYRGTPGSLTQIAYASFAAYDAAVAKSSATWIEFTFPTPVNVTAGELLYVELTSTSTEYQFTWNRTPSSSTTAQKIWNRTPSGNDWVFANNVSRPMQLISITCDY